jgi:uncharacterized protein involved in cysteine biosynthesis
LAVKTPNVNVSRKLRSPAAQPQAIFIVSIPIVNPAMPQFAMALMVHVHKRLGKMGPFVF